MSRPTRASWRKPLLGRALVVLASAAALASAVGGARLGLPELDRWRQDYGEMPQSLREDPVALFLGFDVEVWERLRRSIRRGDRYAVVSTIPEQHEVRNYAAYSLLPAIQVADVDEANIVVYYASAPPSGSECTRIGEQVCLLRREGP